MKPAAEVRYVDPQPSGLASMLGGLIVQNLEADPSRAGLLTPSVAAIAVSDAGVSVTLRIWPQLIEVVDGLDPSATVTVTTDSNRLLSLASAPLRFGLPDILSPGGRAVLSDLLLRRIRIRGLLIHLRQVARLTMLLSVHAAAQSGPPGGG